MATAGRISWKDAGAYIGAQFVGATIGAIVLFLVALSSDYNSWNDGGLGANRFGDGAGTGLIGAILVELVLTFIFVFIILGVTDVRAGTNATAAPLAIGLSLAAIHFVGIPLTGTSVNPARSFGPALFSGTDALANLPVFLIVPALGGAVAGFVYPLIFNKDGSEIAGAGLAFGGDSMTPAHRRAGLGLPGRRSRGPGRDSGRCSRGTGCTGGSCRAGRARYPRDERPHHRLRRLRPGGQQSWQQPTRPPRATFRSTSRTAGAGTTPSRNGSRSSSSLETARRPPLGAAFGICTSYSPGTVTARIHSAPAVSASRATSNQRLRTASIPASFVRSTARPSDAAPTPAARTMIPTRQWPKPTSPRPTIAAVSTPR